MLFLFAMKDKAKRTRIYLDGSVICVNHGAKCTAAALMPEQGGGAGEVAASGRAEEV